MTGEIMIDFHTHIFPEEIIKNRKNYLERDHWFDHLYHEPKARMVTAEELLEAMRLSGVSKSVVFGFSWAEQKHCSETNDYVLDAARRYPGKLLPFISVQPKAGREAIREMERCFDAGARGVGELLPDGQAFNLSDEEIMTPLLAVIRERNMPVVIHSSEPVGHHYRGKGETSPRKLFRFVAKHQGIKFVLCHWGGGLIFFHLMPSVEKKLKDVYYDSAASPFLYDPHIYRVAAQICPNRILFGSDYPLISQRRALAEVDHQRLSSEIAEKIKGKNARKLLNKED